jgi:hypothetical protein
MLKGTLAVTALLVAGSTLAAEPAGRQGWYPKAGDLCAEFVARMSKPEQYGDLQKQLATKDPAIAKYVTDFNAASGTNDKGGAALLALSSYCSAHGMTKLGDVTAQAVNGEANAGKAGSSTQSASVDTSGIDNWYRQTVYYCGADNACTRFAKKSYEDAVSCARGDAKACSEGSNNLLKLRPWLDTWLDAWYKQVLGDCGADSECKSIAKTAYDHGFACNRGDAKACAEKSGIETELARLKAKRGT